MIDRPARWRALWLALCGLFLCATPASLAAERGFPFDHELLLDARPMRGSKRIPSLEVAANGRATIDLWCASGKGEVSIAADTITIVPGTMGEAQCPPERMRGDEDLLAALAQVTSWRREGDSVYLIGPKTLRFRLATH